MKQFHCIELVDHPSDEHREAAVYLPLRTHNQEASPLHWKAREHPENDPVPLNLFAYAADGSALGGLIGTTAFSWLKVDLVAIAKEHRGQGIGLALLTRAEEIAKDRGCKYAYADTMEYQAPKFYQRAGYHLAGKLEDWDSHGHQKYFFKKDLL